MFWMREAACQVGEWRAERAHWRADMARYKAARRAARKSGERLPEDPGPPPTGFALLPWLLMGMGSFSNLLQGRTPLPWIGALGLLTFNSLYIYVTFRAFAKETRDARSTRVALVVMGAVTCALAIVYGGSWLYFFPLLGLATGAVMRGPWLGSTGLALTALAATVSSVREGWDALNVAYGTFLSTMVTAAILSLTEAVRELRAAREELARRAVEEERLRFSRDLHDLLGHTLSVIVVKSEAARRLAPRDMDAALLQITDIESVGRQALTEIREAVTGYRQGSLATELDRADSVLTAAAVTPVIHRSGPPLPSPTEALLGWVVREAVTNVLRHSGATRCEITVEGAGTAGTGIEGTGAEGTGGRVRLTVADNGTGATPPAGAARTGTGIGGTGLKGLTERLAAAGGSLSAGPIPQGGFLVTAELPGLPGLPDLAAETASPASSSSPSSPLSPSPSQVNPHIRPTLTP
ncbi:sensor histidine kinase [Streptomyces sp. SID12488]|uniref:sensor histidine kinase n=1 Tax=Streptomyces sp. SID12488 TaxID=2706040 RepID=UPI0013D920F9|nr:sensor histidine kinase [Streptomyces sp. SID12488]NEA61997.1 sensor histidine kinase [Streptomyces sp. SID12488]